MIQINIRKVNRRILQLGSQLFWQQWVPKADTPLYWEPALASLIDWEFSPTRIGKHIKLEISMVLLVTPSLCWLFLLTSPPVVSNHLEVQLPFFFFFALCVTIMSVFGCIYSTFNSGRENVNLFVFSFAHQENATSSFDFNVVLCTCPILRTLRRRCSFILSPELMLSNLTSRLLFLSVLG